MSALDSPDGSCHVERSSAEDGLYFCGWGQLRCHSGRHAARACRARLGADVVFGSSVGAINAAYYAGTPTLEGIKSLEAIWRGLRRNDVFPVTWRTLLGFIRRRDFLVTSEGLRRLIETYLPYRNLEDAKIPIHVVATNILSGETVVLAKGSAAEAIIASAAIPAAFAPVQSGALYLADGAICSNTPVKVAVAHGARRLIILPTGYACALQTPPVGAVANALHA